MENIFELLDEKSDFKDLHSGPRLMIDEGHVEFSNIWFSYEVSKPFLKGISFKVPFGKTTAMVGQSGSGKSTVIRLLLRLFDVQQGIISIDGQDISKVTIDSLNEVVGIVPQNCILFNANIRYNIRYGRLDATDEEVEAAAIKADIHEKILSFPDGYDTELGENGMKLSGGEKQKLEIARLILKDPKIVLLDEPTSAQDTHTESDTLATLRRFCENKTTLIAAHRLNTIVHTDEILVFHEGEVMERGRHDDLLRMPNGHYAAMWTQQCRYDSQNHMSELTLNWRENYEPNENQFK